MATLRDQLQSRIDELDSQISRVRKGAEEEITRLATKRAKLLAGAAMLTPELELAVEGLQREGFLGGTK